MPFVVSFYKDGTVHPEQLKTAFSELVPATYHSPDGPLAPGDISSRNKKQTPEDDFEADVFVRIQALETTDRLANMGDRANALKAGLEELFPGVSFDVWANLGNYSWSSNTPDPYFDGDMSMTAALARAKVALGDHPVTSMLDKALLTIKIAHHGWPPNVLANDIGVIAQHLGIDFEVVKERLKELSEGYSSVIGDL